MGSTAWHKYIPCTRRLMAAPAETGCSYAPGCVRLADGRMPRDPAGPAAMPAPRGGLHSVAEGGGALRCEMRGAELPGFAF